MHRVRVIRGNHEAAGNRRADLPVRSAQREAKPGQGIIQEGGIRTLAGGGTDFLIVKHGAYVHRVPGAAFHQGSHASPGAFQVVDPCAGEKRVPGAPHSRPFPAVQEQVVAEDILPADAGRFRDFLHQAALRVLVSVHRQQVRLRIILEAVVHFPVKVDRLVRNQHRVPVQVHQADTHTVPFPDSQPAGDGQRPVQPGRHDHPSVPFHIQPHIVIPGILEILLQFEGRRIPVGRHNPEGREPGFRNLEGDHRGIIPYHEILSARVHQPGIRFLQFRKSRFFQHIPEPFRSVERRGGLLRKIQKLFQTIHLVYLL